MRQRLVVLVIVGAVLAATVAAAGPAGAATRTAATRTAGTPNYQALLRAAVNDLQAYWSKEFPQVYGGTYKPVGPIIAADANTKIPDCQGQPISYAKEVKGNAFYCFQSNFIVYDNQNLFPALAKNFGPFSTALVLAHEWGHAIQDRAGIDKSQFPTILIELQADCFAGTWMKRVANGDSSGVRFVGGDLDTSLAAYLKFRDSIGTTPTDQQAHGDAFDRVNAFQTGYDNGAGACKAFLEGSPPPITEQSFTNAQDAATGGNLPAPQVLPVTMELLNEFYANVAPSVPPLTIDHVFKFNSNGPTSQFPKCPGTLTKKVIQNRVFYCLNNDYIAFDEPLLDNIYKTIGDFGDATLIGSAYATYVQFKQNFPGVQDNTVNAVLGADCYTGTWAQAVLQGLPSKTLNVTVSLSPGDLDKAIQAFITYDTARGVSVKSDFVFRRVEAFRKGFFTDFNTCTQTYASATSVPSG